MCPLGTEDRSGMTSRQGSRELHEVEKLPSFTADGYLIDPLFNIALLVERTLPSFACAM